ncbi:hypothetical protein KFE25_011577 [Diacronema lutheri]|uniref:PX domain-containing protein n=1 Tax=Diacronema lutheri TaxID=2081491 RepID=A0A8J6C4Y1_DIALT|nr:hypothetical protein KFE25_011577 [Diacronema lutheri]
MFAFHIDANVTGVDASGDAVTYVVTVRSGDATTTIGKRFSQFHSLRDALTRTGLRGVPQLPGRFHVCDKFHPQLIVERQRALDQFLSECFHHTLIAESTDFVTFFVPAFQPLWHATHDAEVARLEGTNAQFAAELDAARSEKALLAGALGRMLARASRERAMRRALVLWSREAREAKAIGAPVADGGAHLDVAKMPPPPARPGWNTLYANVPTKTTAGCLRSAAPRPPLKTRSASSVADVLRDERGKRSHAAVSLAASLGLGANKVAPTERRLVHTLSSAGSVFGDGSSARLDPENQSLSGFSMF